MIAHSATAAIMEDLARRKTIEHKVTIVVAHTDNESIGMGAQLCRLRNALLIQITDGAPRDGYDAATHGYATITDYSVARHIELATALEIGGARGVRTAFIGLTDQEACFHLVELTGRVVELLRTEAPKAIFAHAYAGGHPDHDAASFGVNAYRG